MSLFSTRTLPVPPPAPRPIASVATGITPFEQAEPFACGSEVSMSQLLHQLDGARALFAATSTTDVRQYTLENVVLDTDSMLLFKDGALLPESEYFAPPYASRSVSDPGIPPRGDDGSDVILGYNCAHHAYQHWLTQCVPAIDWCVRQQAGRPVQLLLPPLLPWEEDFLRLLGHDHVPRLAAEPRTLYRLKRLHFAEFLTGVHTFAVSQSLRQTLDRILAAVPPAPANGATDAILYVPGSNFYYGTLTNEAELMRLMRGHGVRVVEPGLPTTDRINLFRNAQVVIGPVGQGLTDIAFCRPGTLLWEWMPRHHVNPSYNRLAQAGRIDYLGDVFPIVPGPVTGREWHAEPEAIRQRLDQISDRLARRGATAVAVPPPAPDTEAAASLFEPFEPLPGGAPTIPGQPDTATADSPPPETASADKPATDPSLSAEEPREATLPEADPPETGPAHEDVAASANALVPFASPPSATADSPLTDMDRLRRSELNPVPQAAPAAPPRKSLLSRWLGS